MLERDTTTHPLHGITVGDGYAIPVPWEKADEWQARLRDRGIPATVVMEPLEKEAHLELSPGVDVRQVRSLIDEWRK